METGNDYSLWASMKDVTAAELVYACISAVLLYGSCFMAICFLFGMKK